ncbi:MAG: hypothetical protein WEB85_15425, partial [Dongiaceae bacterium]
GTKSFTGGPGSCFAAGDMTPPDRLHADPDRADSGDALDRLALLERRYDGPIPEAMRAAVRGDAAAGAAAEAALFDRLARHAVAALAAWRGRRGVGAAVTTAIAADLRRYRAAGLAWRRPPGTEP